MQRATSDSALEARARRAARRAGLLAIKSRQHVSLDNFGGFALIDQRSNFVVAGSRFDLSPADVIAMCASAEPAG